MSSTFTNTDQRTKWNVRIEFDDGPYECNARAETKLGAFRLGLIDARLASPFGSFFGEVRSWEATPI